jgi:altronate hydrolase
MNELRSSDGATVDLIERLPEFDFVIVNPDDLLAAPRQSQQILEAVQRCKRAIVYTAEGCSPVFQRSEAELEGQVQRWLRSGSGITVRGEQLDPHAADHRQLVREIQTLVGICQEYGVTPQNVAHSIATHGRAVTQLLAPRCAEELRSSLNEVASPIAPSVWAALAAAGIIAASEPAVETAHEGPLQLVRIDARDTVAFAPSVLAAGTTVECQGEALSIVDDTPIGHMVALRPVASGEPVTCYGAPIGVANRDIAAGAKVTSVNLDALPVIEDPLRTAIGYLKDGVPAGAPVRWEMLDRNLPCEPDLSGWSAPPSDWKPQSLPVMGTFNGYRRGPGRFGVRQIIAVISQVGCTEAMTEQLMPRLRRELQQRYPHMQLVNVAHGMGCSHTANVAERLPQLIKEIANNDNIAAIVWMGLGCQQVQQTNLVSLQTLINPPIKKPERWIVAQNEPNEYRALRNAVLELSDEIGSQTREAVPVSELMAFVECGGSDGLSGVTANPLVGQVARMLAAQGASIMIGETTELPEEHFREWCVSEEVLGRCLVAKMRYNRYLAEFGGDERFNPVHGNKAGGLSTALHKARGAAQKIAGIPIMECVSYGEPASRRLAGVSFVDAPSNDPISVTARMISGATIGWFTSGRMTPWGSSIAPTIKVGTNSNRSHLKRDWADFDAGELMSQGASMEDLADKLYRRSLEVANGALTRSERLGTTGVQLWLPHSGLQ